jgi:hypothetical protein
MADLPDWLTVGAKIAEWTNGRGAGSGSVHYATVKTVGKRYVVLDNGNRYDQQGNLSRRSGGSWGNTWYLRPLNDPDVRAAVAASNRIRTYTAIEKPLEERRRTGNPDTLRQIIAALSKHLPEEG